MKELNHTTFTTFSATTFSTTPIVDSLLQPQSLLRQLIQLSLLCPKFFFFVFFKQEITSDKSDIFTYNISLQIFTTVHYESNLTTKLHLVGPKRCLILTHFSPMSHFYTPWKHRFRVVQKCDIGVKWAKKRFKNLQNEQKF